MLSNSNQMLPFHKNAAFCLLNEALFDVGAQECRLHAYLQARHLSHAWCTSRRGQFSSRESARFRIIVENDFSNTCTQICAPNPDVAHTQTCAQILLANPLMPQHNGLLLVMQLQIFFALRERARCRCLRDVFGCFTAGLKANCDILANIIAVPIFLRLNQGRPLSRYAHVSGSLQCAMCSYPLCDTLIYIICVSPPDWSSITGLGGSALIQKSYTDHLCSERGGRQSLN